MKDKVKRIGGQDRYATAALIAKEAFAGEEVKQVVIVTGRNFPDALSAGGFAGFCDSPILISNETRLNAQTKALLKSYKSLEKVTVIGATFSDNFYQELAAATGLTRQEGFDWKGTGIYTLAGKDRYDTSKAVLEALLENESFKPDYVFVTTGKTPADALSASAAAYRYGYPIVLSRKNGLTEDVRSIISERGLRVVMLGGAEAVNDPNLNIYKRLEGSNRYATSVAIARFCANTLDSDGYGNVAIASGADKNYPDALVGGMLLGRKGGQMILVRGLQPDNNPYPAEYFKEKKTAYTAGLQNVYILGSEEAVKDDTVNKIIKVLS